MKLKNVVNGHGYDEGLFSFKSVGCERMFQELTAQYGDDPELKEACFIANCGLMLDDDFFRNFIHRVFEHAVEAWGKDRKNRRGNIGQCH